MKTKTLKALEAVAASLNCSIKDVEQTKHYKVKVDGPNGAKFVVTLACTPGSGDGSIEFFFKKNLKAALAKAGG
jgi:hypothetical protein